MLTLKEAAVALSDSIQVYAEVALAERQALEAREAILAEDVAKAVKLAMAPREEALAAALEKGRERERKCEARETAFASLRKELTQARAEIKTLREQLVCAAAETKQARTEKGEAVGVVTRINTAFPGLLGRIPE
jgi:chromosome segregation ATPase